LDEVLIWAVENEHMIFGHGLLARFAQRHSEEVFECLLLAVEEAKAQSTDIEKRKSVLIRKARNLFWDRLRRRYGVRAGSGGRVLRTEEITFSPDDLAVQMLSTESAEHETLVRHFTVGPQDVRRALETRFSPEEVRMLELKLEGCSSTVVAAELGLSPSNVRKRLERLRPEIAQCIAEVTGLEPYFIERLLGARATARSRTQPGYVLRQAEEAQS